MSFRISFLLLLLGCAVPAWAQHTAPPGVDPNASFQPLPERKDVVSWKTLAQVELVKQKGHHHTDEAGGSQASHQSYHGTYSQPPAP